MPTAAPVLTACAGRLGSATATLATTAAATVRPRKAFRILITPLRFDTERLRECTTRFHYSSYTTATRAHCSRFVAHLSDIAAAVSVRCRHVRLKIFSRARDGSIQLVVPCSPYADRRNKSCVRRV